MPEDVVRIGFSRGRSLAARLICSFTGADVSHSFFYVSGSDGEWAYEAVPGGFRRVPWSEYRARNSVRSLVDMEWDHAEVRAHLDGMLGTPYALMKLLAIGALVVLHRRPGTRWTENAIDCVTSVGRVLREFARIEVGEALTPADLQDRISRR